MIGSGGEMGPLKMPPTPQVSVLAFQAASTQQDAPGQSVRETFEDNGAWTIRLWGSDHTSCAFCRSFASCMAFCTPSIAEKDMSSKHRLFRVFQRFHIIHGHSGLWVPTGGREIILLPSVSMAAREAWLVSGLRVRGAGSNTSAAKGQSLRTWRSSSVPPHHLQGNGRTPRLVRLELTGMALLITFHRKSFSLGEVCTFQICFSQSKEGGRLEGLLSMEQAIP